MHEQFLLGIQLRWKFKLYLTGYTIAQISTSYNVLYVFSYQNHRHLHYFGVKIEVPWRYVHPQNDHATFRPTPYFHPTFRPLWQFTTVKLRPLNIFRLWQMDTVTIYYCDNSTP
jgi:hypothetical protein